MTVLAATAWRTNADMIADVADVGYLSDDLLTLDMTYGSHGGFWTVWRPTRLVTCDLGRGTPDIRFDFTRAPFRDGTFPRTVLDAPYKLNGTPDGDVDPRYGVHEVASRDERHALMYAGLTEAIRVTEPGGLVLFKCQPQVNSGRVWWQDRMFAEHAESLGCRHVDSALFLAHRGQPEGRWVKHDACKGKGCAVCFDLVTVFLKECAADGRKPPKSAKPGRVWTITEQQHFGHNYSALLIIQKPKTWVRPVDVKARAAALVALVDALDPATLDDVGAWIAPEHAAILNELRPRQRALL